MQTTCVSERERRMAAQWSWNNRIESRYQQSHFNQELKLNYGPFQYHVLGMQD